MDADPEQEQFRALFSELRRADERRAPSFQRDWQAAVARKSEPRQPVSWARLAGVGAIAVVMLAVAGIAVATFVGHSHSPAPVVRQALPAAPGKVAHGSPAAEPIVLVSGISISDWESPTAFLLDLSPGVSDSAGPTTEPADGAAPHSQDRRHL